MTESGGGPTGSSPADRYERMYPDTGIPDAQKQERQERIDFKQERREGRRTGRSRGVVIPALPWKEN